MDQDPKMQGTQPVKTPTPTTPPEPVSGGVADGTADTGAQVVSANAPATDQPVIADTKMVPPASGTADAVSKPTVAPAQPASPVSSKPKRTGLIVTIIILIIVLLAGIGTAIWYFCFYSNPDKVAYDAVTSFLKQPSLVSDGSVMTRMELDNGNTLSFVVGLKAKSDDNSNSESMASIHFLLTDVDGQEVVSSDDYAVEISNMITSDGVIYLRTDNLDEVVEQIAGDVSIYTETEIDEEAAELVYDLLGKIDGEWWQISVPDLVDELIEDNSVARPIKEFYTCMVDVSHQNIGAQIAGIYNDNRFLKIEKKEGGLFGDSTYRVSFDNEAMANFMNSTLDIEAGKEAEKCIEQLADDLDGTYSIDKTYIDADDIKDVSDEVEFEMVISNFGHELKAISAGLTNLGDDEYFTIGFDFSHPAVTVSAPQDYRPITELFEEIMTVVMEFGQSVPGNNPSTEQPWIDPENPWNDDLFDYDWGEYWNYN